MLHIKSLLCGKSLFDALNSDVRIGILEILTERGEVNLNSIAKELGLSNGAITPHIRKLQLADLIDVRAVAASRGSQKFCTLKCRKVLIDFFEEIEISERVYTYDIDVGHYTDYKIRPTCGIVTPSGILGAFDDPRYFSFPERFNAGLVWLGCGYLEYEIPNNLKLSERMSELQISVEISSEAPGFSEHYPSDIYFEINGCNLGMITTPGEYGDRKGMLNPDWWYSYLGQYGRLKMITVNEKGTFVDGLQISPTTAHDLNITSESKIKLRIGVHKDAYHVGGLKLFGKEFGDHATGILTKMFFEEIPNGKGVLLE